MRLAKKTLGIGFALLLCLVSLSAEKRVALVIGNGSYRSAPLKNPRNDATDVAAALKTLGFSVSLGLDLDLAELRGAIRDFAGALDEPGAISLFYYAGHGMQFQGENYLIPVGSDIQAADELPLLALDIAFLYNKLDSGPAGTNLVILDCCRNNPFSVASRSLDRGLSVVSRAPRQSLIIYATGANQVAQDGNGRNGLFTAALLNHLNDDADVELMMREVRSEVLSLSEGRQNPYSYGSMTSGFNFTRQGGGGEPRAASVGRHLGQAAAEVEEEPRPFSVTGRLGYIPNAYSMVGGELSYRYLDWLSLTGLVGHFWGGSDGGSSSYGDFRFSTTVLVFGPVVNARVFTVLQPYIGGLFGYKSYKSGHSNYDPSSGDQAAAPRTESGFGFHLNLGIDYALSSSLNLGIALLAGPLDVGGYGTVCASLSLKL